MRPSFAKASEGILFAICLGACPAKPVRAKQDGGARRDRTDDLMLAKHALSQLSYGPNRRTRAGGGRLAAAPSGSRLSKWWAWEDSNLRPHAYQARALTN